MGIVQIDRLFGELQWKTSFLLIQHNVNNMHPILHFDIQDGRRTFFSLIFDLRECILIML